MNMQEKMLSLMSKVKALEGNEAEMSAAAIAGECYFLNADEVLSYKRSFGDARYPYSVDGLNLWAHTSGNVVVEESIFNIILNFFEGMEPNLAFFVGEDMGGRFFPVSVTGAAKQPFETDIRRYTVFTPDAAYYFVETKRLASCVRMLVDNKKNLRFTLSVLNLSTDTVKTYASSYFNFMLRRSQFEYIETKWYRRCRKSENGFVIGVTEHIDRNTCFSHTAAVVRSCAAKTVYSTTSRTDFKGGMNDQLNCSIPLQTGIFKDCKEYTEFSDTAIAGDIIPLTLNSGEYFDVTYTAAINDDEATAVALSSAAPSTSDVDAYVYREKGNDEVATNIPEFSFEGHLDGVIKNEKNLGYFLKNVFRQVEFCARAKNYAGPFIGIRDIFQQLEASLMWIPEYSRGKIVEALGYIGDDGRPPRQYSYPANEHVVPEMDLRPYVDQGVWIITTVYSYISFTGDLSILDEVCGYYKLSSVVEFSSERDTVLDHLVRITNYLISKLDTETGCLRILYGDWNDALDGLGRTTDKDKEFGTGVSVMASLQLERNLHELAEILALKGRNEEAKAYLVEADKLLSSLNEYAVVSNAEGKRKVLHGWSDKRGYLIGSFCDNDGMNRDTLTATAYWTISGALRSDPSLKADILEAYDRLDSKYGLKTFEPYFDSSNKDVGRITRLPKGTAENGAVYIHGTLFGIWSLFEMGESKRAWEQLYKILPVTHEFISTTPFVMPNSYIENKDRGLDGESMSDWFTGSGCVLVKLMLWYVFGIRPTLTSLTVSPSEYIPFRSTTVRVNVKGVPVTVRYGKKGNGSRTFKVNGKTVPCVTDERTGAPAVIFDGTLLKNELVIDIEDN